MNSENSKKNWDKLDEEAEREGNAIRGRKSGDTVKKNDSASNKKDKKDKINPRNRRR